MYSILALFRLRNDAKISHYYQELEREIEFNLKIGMILEKEQK